MTSGELVHVSFWSSLIGRLGIMMIVSALVVGYVYSFERIDGRKRLLGVKIFCSLLILGSIYKLWGFWNYEYYRLMFHPVAEHHIFMRYCCSLMLRGVGLIAAVGVLRLKNRFRKILVWLCLFTLCSLYWKHPYFVFENIARHTEQIFLNKETVTELSHPAYPWISLMFNYTLDIVFSGSMLYYFTRPKVKEQFS